MKIGEEVNQWKDRRGGKRLGERIGYVGGMGRVAWER